jgi:hypothetical protein
MPTTPLTKDDMRRWLLQMFPGQHTMEQLQHLKSNPLRELVRQALPFRRPDARDGKHIVNTELAYMCLALSRSRVNIVSADETMKIVIYNVNQQQVSDQVINKDTLIGLDNFVQICFSNWCRDTLKSNLSGMIGAAWFAKTPAGGYRHKTVIVYPAEGLDHHSDSIRLLFRLRELMDSHLHTLIVELTQVQQQFEINSEANLQSEDEQAAEEEEEEEEENEATAPESAGNPEEPVAQVAVSELAGMFSSGGQPLTGTHRGSDPGAAAPAASPAQPDFSLLDETLTEEEQKDYQQGESSYNNMTGTAQRFMIQALPRKTIAKDKSRGKARSSRDKEEEDDDATVEMPVKDDDADMESDSDAEQAPMGKQKPKEKLEAMPKMAIMQKDFDQRKAAVKGEPGFADVPIVMAMVEECESIMEKLKKNKQAPFKDLLKDQLTTGQLGDLLQDRVIAYSKCPVMKARTLSKNFLFSAERARLESIAKTANDTVQLLDLTVKMAFAACYTVPTTGRIEHGSLGHDVQSIRDEKLTKAPKPDEDTSKGADQNTWGSWATSSFMGRFFSKKK